MHGCDILKAPLPTLFILYMFVSVLCHSDTNICSMFKQLCLVPFSQQVWPTVGYCHWSKPAAKRAAKQAAQSSCASSTVNPSRNRPQFTVVWSRKKKFHTVPLWKGRTEHDVSIKSMIPAFCMHCWVYNVSPCVWFQPLPPSDVFERPYTVRGGPPPPPLDPPPPFQCLRLTAKILLQRQEDLSVKIFWPAFGRGHRGTLGGGGSQPNPPAPF